MSQAHGFAEVWSDSPRGHLALHMRLTSPAALEHAANLADVSAEVLAMVSVVHGELLGEPSAELRAKLADSEVPQLFTPYESM